MWNIARSAEAMFTRWAVKRFCRFLLKKKLGKFILGDIDLDQLDVQLVSGIIQLSGLALNVDYINEKLRTVATFIVKEGSLGSLLVNLPWGGSGCEIEVDELEIVLTPLMEEFLSEGYQCFHISEDNSSTQSKCPEDVKKITDNIIFSSSHVHEGVKRVANMLKWLFTSFHIKIRRLIVALDSLPSIDEARTDPNTALVLRVAEAECRIHVSEDANMDGNRKYESFLGVTQLMNIIKFHGALVELIQEDGVESSPHVPNASGFLSCQRSSHSNMSNVNIPLICGKNGGVSGELKLTIPWKNGTLDVCNLDSDMKIDLLKLKLQPTTVKWLLQTSQWFKKFGKHDMCNMHHDVMDSVYYNSFSHFSPSVPDSSVTGIDKLMGHCDNISPAPCSFLDREEQEGSAFLNSNLISNWIPVSVDKIQVNKTEEDSNYGASLNQFFECIDEVRCLQSSTSSRGIWNWASSVFSTIGVASSLELGSLHVPAEQQIFEINFNATVAGICLVFFLDDESADCMRDAHNQLCRPSIHFLDVKVQEILLSLRVGSQEKEFQARTKGIEVTDHLSLASENKNPGLCASFVRHLQEEVEGAFPPFCSSVKRSSVLSSSDLGMVDFPSSTLSLTDYRFDNASCQINENFEFVKVKLLSTTGISSFQCTMKSDSLASSDASLTSFKLKLSPFSLWLNLNMISLLINFWKEVGGSIQVNSSNDEIESTSMHNRHDCFIREGIKTGPHSTDTCLSSKESVQGDIVISSGRIIFCFPMRQGGDSQSYFNWDEFIVLNFYSQPSPNGQNVRSTVCSPFTSFQERYSLDKVCLLSVHASSFNVHLLTTAATNATGNKACEFQKIISSYHVLSVESTSGTSSVISMIWQENPVIDPCLGRKLKNFASSGNTSRNNAMGNCYEFASTCTATNVEDSKFSLDRETVKSSGFFMHMSLSPVTIRLDNLQYKVLYCILTKLFDGLFSGYHLQTAVNDTTGCQRSYFIDCETVVFFISPSVAEDSEDSFPFMVPGHWCQLKLKIQKFEFRYVSSLGCTAGANFFWIGNKEGNLLGSLTKVPSHELLLITCNNSCMGRGNGGGSNSLSCGLAGFDMIQMWGPQSHDCWTSITFRGGTIVGVGGRFDWLDVVLSFFSLTSSKTGQETNELERNASFNVSLVLNLVDVGLSYESYLGTSSINDHSEMQKELNKYVACLLAASSLTLYSCTVEDSVIANYKIKVHDLGMLLSLVPDTLKVDKSFSVEGLQKSGYANVAGEAFIEASLSVNCKNGLLWEFECSDCHSCISLDSCSDTTDGLFCLFSRLQQLFAPDMEDYIEHLQARWNNAQHAHERCNRSDRTYVSNNRISGPSAYCSGISILDTTSKSIAFDLMDKVSDDTFHFVRNEDVSPFYEPSYGLSPHGKVSGDACKPSICGIEMINNYCQPKLFSHLPSVASDQLSVESSNCPCSNRTCLITESEKNGWYHGTSFKIVENHIFEASKQNNSVKPKFVSLPRGRIILKNISARWRMFGGCDWVDSKTQSSNICRRDATSCLELALIGINVRYENFPDGQTSTYKFSFTVKDIYFYDNSINAPWKMVLGHYESRERPRESSSDALKLDLEAFRPDPSMPLEEYRLKIAFLPMILHLHQTQLDFLLNFFAGTLQSPGLSSEFDRTTESPRICGEALLPYFQKFDIWPSTVRINYTPSCVDFTALQGGKYAELVNLVSWKGIELHLKHIRGVGVYGWNGLCELIIGEWIQDITQNQLYKLVQGFPMIRSLVAVGSGAAKIVSSPIKSYKKDRRLVKGLQRGTVAFLRSLSLEAVGLGLHLAAETHDILLQAEYVLTNVPESASLSRADRIKTKAGHNQPKDTQHGLKQAFESFTDGLGRSASVLVRTPMNTYKRGGSAGSSLASAVRAAPAAAMAPASAAAGAVHYALLGIRNSLDPEHKRESMKKYSGPSQYVQ